MMRRTRQSLQRELTAPPLARRNAHAGNAPTAQGEPAHLVQRALHDPTALRPGELLELQHIVGNAAIGRLLAGQDRGDAPAHRVNHGVPVQRKMQTRGLPSARGTIQRLIGFELETRIPLYKEKTPGNYKRPDYDTIHADVGTGDNSEIGVDKDGPVSIAEFASGPVSDTQSEKSFKATATRWVNVLTDLREDASNTPPLKNLHTKYNSAPPKSRFGFLPTDNTDKMQNLAIQVTHGLRLDKVSSYLDKMKLKDISGPARFDNSNRALGETGPAMDQMMLSVTQAFDPATIIPKKGDRKKAAEEVRGFLSLIAQYLIAGGKGSKSLIKNQTALFYKSKLSDVRNNLVASNAYAAHILDPTNWTSVKTDLLTGTGRTQGQKVFYDSNTTCQAFLNNVLTGNDDPVFEEAKNDWGSPIAPGTVKGKNAAVVEHRSIDREMLPGDNVNLSNPDDVVKYLVKIFKLNKKLQDL